MTLFFYACYQQLSCSAKLRSSSRRRGEQLTAVAGRLLPPPPDECY